MTLRLGFSTILFSVLFSICGYGQERLISEQSSVFPLFTSLTSKEQNSIDKAFEFGNLDLKKIESSKAFLKQLADKGDALAQYYYALTLDLAPYGMGVKKMLLRQRNTIKNQQIKVSAWRKVFFIMHTNTLF